MVSYVQLRSPMALITLGALAPAAAQLLELMETPMTLWRLAPCQAHCTRGEPYRPCSLLVVDVTSFIILPINRVRSYSEMT